MGGTSIRAGAGAALVLLLTGCSSDGPAGQQPVEVRGEVLDRSDVAPPAVALEPGPVPTEGPVLDSDGTGWVDTSSSSERPGRARPAVGVAVIASSDEEPVRQVRCQATLRAPGDRVLLARGELTVSLRIEARDGTVRDVPRQRLSLQATVAPGQVLALGTSPAYRVEAAEVRRVTCVAELT